MIYEIKSVDGDLQPFDNVTIFSPVTATAENTIALGTVEHFSDEAEPGTYSYMGPISENPNRGSHIRILGPVINHDSALGDPKNILHEIEFPQEGVIFVSEPTYSFGGEKVYGVWDKVGA